MQALWAKRHNKVQATPFDILKQEWSRKHEFKRKPPPVVTFIKEGAQSALPNKTMGTKHRPEKEAPVSRCHPYCLETGCSSVFA